MRTAGVQSQESLCHSLLLTTSRFSKPGAFIIQNKLQLALHPSPPLIHYPFSSPHLLLHPFQDLLHFPSLLWPQPAGSSSRCLIFFNFFFPLVASCSGRAGYVLLPLTKADWRSFNRKPLEDDGPPCGLPGCAWHLVHELQTPQKQSIERGPSLM